jgi:hypothetical protein
MADEKKQEDRGYPTDAYKAGREGDANIIDTDTPAETEARQRGEQDRINAQQTEKEQAEKKNDD